MCQNVNLLWKLAVQNAACVFVNLCGGYKNFGERLYSVSQ